MNKDCNTEEVTNIGNQGSLGVLSMFSSNYRINGRDVNEGGRMNFLKYVYNFLKVQLFSEPEFKGNCQIFEKNTRCIDSFAVKSSKILDGR